MDDIAQKHKDSVIKLEQSIWTLAKQQTEITTQLPPLIQTEIEARREPNQQSPQHQGNQTHQKPNKPHMEGQTSAICGDAFGRRQRIQARKTEATKRIPRRKKREPLKKERKETNTTRNHQKPTPTKSLKNQERDQERNHRSSQTLEKNSCQRIELISPLCKKSSHPQNSERKRTLVGSNN